MNWYVGDVPQISLLATDPKTKAPVTPTTVKLTIISPAGVQETVSMAKTGEGAYLSAVELTEKGPWRSVIKTTGSYQGVKRDVLTARIP